MKRLPSFEEREGNSLILVRTAKGRELFRNAEADGVVKAEAFDTGSIFAIQPFQYYRRTTILPRLLAMKLLLLKTLRTKASSLAKGPRRSGSTRASRRSPVCWCGARRSRSGRWKQPDGLWRSRNQYLRTQVDDEFQFTLLLFRC